MGGYREIVNDLAGPSRGVFVVVRNLYNNVYSGYNDGLQVVPINNNGAGGGVVDYKFAGPILTTTLIDGGSGYTSATYSNVPLIYDALSTGSGTGARATVVVAAGVVTSVTLTSGGIRFVKDAFLTIAAASLGGAGSGVLIQVCVLS